LVGGQRYQDGLAEGQGTAFRKKPGSQTVPPFDIGGGITSFSKLNVLAPGRSNVEMRRVNIMLFLLLLSLGRVTAADFIGAANGGSPATGRSIAFVHLVGHHPQDAARDFHPAKHVLRHLNRRLGTIGGATGGLPPVPGAMTGYPDWAPASLRFSAVESPADLLHCWQFNLRAAAEPRAPSSLL
jgi:hypothetical protein